jgi:hypothetical protein
VPESKSECIIERRNSIYSVKRIKIITEKVQMEGELNNTETARKIYDILPIEAKVRTWGEEIYFPIPVDMDLENGVEVVNVGTLGYWPEGRCFCIFFGKTPTSTEKEIRPASAVTVVGNLLGEAKEWKRVKDGEKIRIEKA